MLLLVALLTAACGAIKNTTSEQTASSEQSSFGAQLEAQAAAVAEKIRDALAQPYALSDFTHLCTSSIGITLFKGGDLSMAELLKQADRAMYLAKYSGRNAIAHFRE